MLYDNNLIHCPVSCMHRHRPESGFDFPVAVLAAGLWLRVAVLLPLVFALWAAIAWALQG